MNPVFRNKLSSFKNVLWCCFVLISLSLSAESLRVLSLNAEWFPGRVPEPTPLAAEIHMCKVQHLLTDINPDILLLQEVRHKEAVDELISVLPDFKVHAISEFDAQQELVIASRLEAVAAWTQQWEPHEKHFQPRGMAFSVLHLPLQSEDETIAVYTVHFKSNYLGEENIDEAEKQEQGLINAALREASARQLTEHAEWTRDQQWEPPLTSILVGGDINTTYPRPLVRNEQTFAIMKNGRLTPLGLPGIDHFLAKGRLRKGEASVLGSYRVSDHQPILFELELRNEKGWDRAAPLTVSEDGEESCIAININQATVEDLQILPGIGPVLSRRIFENRPYKTIPELRRVHGIGPKRLERIKNLIYVEP